MIELLIKYIQDKGYRVEVIPRVLLIRKRVGDELYGIDWAIPESDLTPDMEEILYYEATKRCDLIEEAIAERAKENV